MINKIDISDVIPFQNTQSLDDLRKFNYFLEQTEREKRLLAKC